MNSFFMRRQRQAIVCLCIAATLLLGFGAQLHGLSHALQAVQTSAHQDMLAAHTCEQCLQFAALDGGLATDVAALLAVIAADAVGPTMPATTLRGAAFNAYSSRAPPQRG